MGAHNLHVLSVLGADLIEKMGDEDVANVGIKSAAGRPHLTIHPAIEAQGVEREEAVGVPEELCSMIRLPLDAGSRSLIIRNSEEPLGRPKTSIAERK